MVNADFGIVGNRLYPFNESYANQARFLADLLGAKVFTCNELGFLPLKRLDGYLIINSKFVVNNTPVLSTFNGLLIYLSLKLFERQFDTILLTAGVESEFLDYLNLEKCVPIVSTIDDEEKYNKFVSEIAPKLKKIIVQSKKVKDKLIASGFDSGKIYLSYPVIDTNKFEYSEPPPQDNFKILFASAPTVETSEENNFEAKGLPLLLESFRDFLQEIPATLYLLWRNKYNEELWSLINELELDEHVILINDVVDVREWYKKTHVTVIPYTNSWRSPDYPLSALESLLCGRPVVTTDVVELAEFVEEQRCGKTARARNEEFMNALKDCKVNYQEYHRNCEAVGEITSSSVKEVFNENFAAL